MHSFDATFHRLVKQTIEEELHTQRLLVTDRPSRSFEDYLLKVGRIDGLRLALRVMEDVEHRLQQGPASA